MAKHFSYASEPHPVWAPLAAKIHEAVWDDVGLEKVQGFVRQWAEEFNQRQAEVEKAQKDWRKKAMKRAKKVNERFNQHQIAQAKLLENNPKHLCQPYPIKMVGTPCPPDLELPLPPPHRTLSKLEQWADLAAIHDYYGTGEKVNLWPLEQRDEPLPTNKRDRNRHLEELRKQAVGDHYWHLIEEAGRLAEGHKPFIERWLKELVADAANAPAAKPGEGNGGAGSTPLTAKPDRGETGGTKQGLRSFIVHGHDETAKLELKNYLQNRLGWPEPVILAEKRSGGKTIIEKFEEHANNIDVVFVLLTPDDLGGAVGSPSAARARQNVILELGHFTGKFGRTSGRVILLYKGDLEVPSNLAGIVYINISNGVEAAGEKIRREVATLVRIV